MNCQDKLAVVLRADVAKGNHSVVDKTPQVAQFADTQS
jgi:hypothetical protein